MATPANRAVSARHNITTQVSTKDALLLLLAGARSPASCKDFITELLNAGHLLNLNDQIELSCFAVMRTGDLNHGRPLRAIK